MNEELQKFAREKLLEGLGQLDESNRVLFKKMYSPDDPNAHIDNVVIRMRPEDLDWAMQQVKRSLEAK